MIRPKQFSRMGEFYLEEAILDVLLEARHEHQCLGPAAISKRAGIFRERGKESIMNDAIVIGMLVKLYEHGKVHRCKQESGQGGWELTKVEFESRRDDVSL